MTYFIDCFRVYFGRVIIILNILNQVTSVIQTQYVLCDVRNVVNI
jgi:hypothetical protein